MPQSESTSANPIQHYRPLKCGTLMALAHIEPAPEPDHDLRTFECPACDGSEVIKFKFK